jgi:cysteine synthase B
MATSAQEVAAQLGDRLLARIGNTPLLRVSLFEDECPGVTVLAKAEMWNPGGSVKDRPALRMIEEGERDGRLTQDRVILDSTSGNTGIAYAMIGAAKGYRVKLVVPSNVTPERRQLMTAYGAEIVDSDPLEGSDGAIKLAREIFENSHDEYFMPDQYNNPNNWKAHFDGTGQEIWAQTQGSLTHFVAGLGTSGTFVGTARALQEHIPSVECISVQPDSAWHGLEGLKHMSSSILPGIYDTKLADQSLYAPTEDSYELVRQLARHEGILAGHSSGANLWAVREIARSIDTGIIVTIFPDGGDRYLSTGIVR